MVFKTQIGIPLLLETAFNVREYPVVWEEPTDPPAVTTVQERSTFLPAPLVLEVSGTRMLPDFIVSADWYKLAVRCIASIEILDPLPPSCKERQRCQV